MLFFFTSLSIGEGKEKSQIITIQEVFQYPGFCFNGSLIAKLECDETLTTKEKNAMCELPPLAKPSKAPLGPSAGSIGALHLGHQLRHALAVRRQLVVHVHQVPDDALVRLARICARFACCVGWARRA